MLIIGSCKGREKWRLIKFFYMIISHKYKFIFIKTAKTAGTSIEIFLSQMCDERDIFTPIYPHVEPHVARNYKGFWNPLPELFEENFRNFYKLFKQVKKRNKFGNHFPASLIKKRVSKNTWNNYFKFCVERNPWDKTLSHYYMLKNRRGGSLSLEEYLQEGNFCINYPKYTDSNCNIIVNKVIKYESLIEELDSIFSMLGIPFNGSLGVQAKSNYRENRLSYQDILTERQRGIIENIFRKEIMLHDYRF